MNTLTEMKKSGPTSFFCITFNIFKLNGPPSVLLDMAFLFCPCPMGYNKRISGLVKVTMPV